MEKRYEPIRKEFWDEMKEKFPFAFEEFSNWIDQFKIDINWNSLFRDDDVGCAQTAPPKFHDLPQPMQLGIWIQFMLDRGGCSWEIDDMYEFNLEEDIYGTFVMINDMAG